MTQAPFDRLDQLEATLTRFAELSFQSYRHHDEALSRLEANLTRLEANSVRHDEALNRMESAIENMTERLDTVIERSDAERETFIAEIREIWRYLRYQPGNGRSGHDA